MNRSSDVYSDLLRFVKPGDVINQVGHPKWYQFWLYLTYAGIRWHQKMLLGRCSNYYDTHTMMYFDPERTFSVELPKATMIPLENYCMSDLSIYRLDRFASGQTIDISAYKEKMIKIAEEMCGTNYDIGQLLDILINGILGYSHQRKLSIFDFSKKQKVCSVGVRAIIEKLNQEEGFITPGKMLFRDLNIHSGWTANEIAEYRGTDVEATTPAHFANSNLFHHEFRLVAKFCNGKRIFPKPGMYIHEVWKDNSSW